MKDSKRGMLKQLEAGDAYFEAQKEIFFAQIEELERIGHWIYDEKAERYQYVSQVYAEIHEIPYEDFYTESWDEEEDLKDVHEEDRESLAAVYEQSRKSGERYSVDYRILTPNGKERWIREVGAGLEEENGVWIKTIGTVQDITERKEAEIALQQKEERFRSLFYQTPLGISLEDYSLVKKRIDRLKKEGVRDFRAFFSENEKNLKDAIDDIQVLDANATLVRMTDTTSLKEFLEFEENYESWKDPYWRNYYIEEMTAFASGRRAFTSEVNDTTIKGRVTELRCTSRIADGCEDDWSEVITTHEDVTRRRRVEKEKEEALEKAKLANEAKSQFLANMSHELRTPLNAILGFSDVMKQQMFGSLGSDSYVKYAEYIHTSGEHLLMLVSDILNLTKIDGGSQSLQIEAFDVRKLLEDCLTLVVDKASSKDISLESKIPDDLPELVADYSAIKQCVANVLSNAVKFTPDAGKVSISIEASSRWFKFVISDTGIGISKEDLDLLAKPFTQIERMKTGKIHEGTGIGLTIAKSLIEMHGGTLLFSSELNSGTIVTISLPRGDIYP